MTRVGIALSTYSRIDDVKFNVWLVNERWPKIDGFDFDVYVCHNNPAMRQQYSGLQGVQLVVEGADLPFDTKARLRMRQVNCWQTGIMAALSDGCDYAIHYHADAYILDPSWMTSHITYMRDASINISGRGHGLQHVGGKLPEGDIDDHFFIVKNELSQAFFVPPTEGIMSVYASEGYLANRVRASLTNIDMYHHYDDFCANEYSPDRWPRALHPYNYDPKRYLLHTPDSEIREKYFKRVYNERSENV